MAMSSFKQQAAVARLLTFVPEFGHLMWRGAGLVPVLPHDRGPLRWRLRPKEWPGSPDGGRDCPARRKP
jgi:hypothetical protein